MKHRRALAGEMIPELQSWTVLTVVTRCGDLFAIDHEDVVPDILTLSKTLGNGIPLSAVVTSTEIDRVCKEKEFLFYTTHINDPLPAAVGDKVLEICHERRPGVKFKSEGGSAARRSEETTRKIWLYW